MRNRYWLPIVFSVVFIAGIIAGWLLKSESRLSMSANDKLLTVMGLIEDKYVDEVNIDSLVEMTIPELLKNLDPHSAYIAAEDLTNVNSELDGKFSGVGISFRIFNDTLNVIEVINNGPAEKVGIMSGDRIIEVDGDNIAGCGIDNDDVMNMLRGEKGSKVNLTVKRPTSANPLSFTLTRDDIPVESIESHYMLSDDTGYIRVARFGRNTYAEFLQALNQLRLDGAKNFVVDLRSNGGGYMEPAVMMANEFLPVGSLIVSTKGRNPQEDQLLISDGTGAFGDAGLVVLINELSASASEIFSGAIQDNDRGWIVGRRSFGKGLVQSPIMLPDSSQLRLTTQRYYTPSGRCIQKDFKRGDIEDYDLELINRYNNGEILSADSVKLNIDQKYNTAGGRTVYGGGGIMPDYFVPEDTSKVTQYYLTVNNMGLPRDYAYIYVDDNRELLKKAKNVDELLKMLPPDNYLIQDFARYAVANGVPARWYYINISTPLIVNQLKALIAQTLFGTNGYFQVTNRHDKAVEEALRHASKPINIDNQNEK